MDSDLDQHHLSFLREAIRLAEEAQRRGNLPIGAVIVLDGKIVARGMNLIWRPAVDLTRHAEMEALRAVPSGLWPRSREMILFTTLEPCVMCAGAILLHHIGHLAFGATDPYGGVGTSLGSLPLAETMLEDVFCYNEVRGMLGYTGCYGDKSVSVMGTGMGLPTLSIYVHELVTEYNVKTLIRVGTCGALQPDLKVGDIVLAMTASTDSHINKLRFGGMDFAPAASFDLLLKAHEAAKERGIRVYVGGIFSGDSFYSDDAEWWKKWAEYGVLVCEMETSGLYTLAAKFKVDALSVLTVSDSLVTGKSSTAEQRERDFPQMAEIALEISP